MEKRLIIAIAASIIIIMAFQALAPKPPVVSSPMVVTTEMAPTVAVADSAIGAPAPDESLVQEKELEVETDKYILIFSNIGGSIKEVWLKEYRESKTGEPLELVAIQNPREFLCSISSPAVLGLDTAAYALTRSGDTITYAIKQNDLEIAKRYNLHKTLHGIELEVFIKNTSTLPRTISYRIIGGAGLHEKNPQDMRFVEVTSNINGKTMGFKKPKGTRIVNPGIVSWTTLKNKYFSVILKPFVATRDQFYSDDRDGRLVMGVDTAEMTIQPGAVTSNKYVLYAGPSHIPALKELGQGLEETVSYGFFGGISKVMITVMRFFYSIVHSWGLSIILLSVFLNMILFPLTMKSFKSMQKMQELHPEMEKLKKQHKDNPQKLNKEIMELYKTYKINPFSGCLPILLQMPVFIALYAALMRSIELRGTSFLWIKDLSSPDALALPFTLPVIGNSINILPLIMVVAMIAQQKISTRSMGGAVTNEQREQQKIMLIAMPAVFGFIFYNMPSGLVLYWIVNTVLTVLEQGFILKNRAAKA